MRSDVSLQVHRLTTMLWRGKGDFMSNEGLTRAGAAKIAKLAHLHMSDAELDELTPQLSAIIEFVQQLEKIDISGVEAMSHVHGSTNVFREDNVLTSMEIESLLQNVPDHSGHFIRTPLVVE
ncbi:MAG: Asp-tRNA(Asn)/Glu-tRNA(Gln) amidotransferase GatCAB subunit C [Proteobacteria bacterium]|nr:MAG: Asp-tRNA(Asn)/Glu-tRNA(Gln) amidotransferase GatCAB subunit C [Pseudomonadota bacterium]